MGPARHPQDAVVGEEARCSGFDDHVRPPLRDVLVEQSAPVFLDGDPAGVAPADSIQQVREPAGRQYLEGVVGAQPDGDGGCGLGPGGHTVGRGDQRRHVHPEPAPVPEVHRRLVLGVPGHAGQSGGKLPFQLDLTGVAQVERIVERQVDVLDPAGIEAPSSPSHTRSRNTPPPTHQSGGAQARAAFSTRSIQGEARTISRR